MTRSARLRGTDRLGQLQQGETIYRRVALVGCGQRFGTSVAPALWESNAMVVLAADPDPAARLRVTSIAPCASDVILTTTLAGQQLMDSGADAIIISSPSGLHFEHCVIALSCELPTFVEKPLACTAPDARTLQVASQGRLVASEQRIHREDLGYVRSVVRSGALGKISELRYYDSIIAAPHFARSWRNDPRLAGGGVLLDLGYHTVGSMQWLLGLGSEDIVVTDTRLTTSGLRVEDAAQIACRAGGVDISLDVRLVELAPRETVLVRGSRGMVRLDRERKGPSVADISLAIDGEDPTEVRLPLDNDTDSKSLLDFLRGRTRIGGLDRHVNALAFLEQAYNCSGHWKGTAQDAVEGLG